MPKFIFILLIKLLYIINTTLGIRCYQCDSLIDVNCFKNLAMLQSKECENGETECGTKFDFERLHFVRECLKVPDKCMGKFCRRCNQDDCNNHVSCYDDFNDLQGTDIEICRNNDYKCVVQLNDDITVRKCVEKDYTCEKCKICDHSFCNKGIFPEDRLLCYQCTEIDLDCNLLRTLEPKPCWIYNEDEECYNFGTSENNMNRGCMSDSNKKFVVGDTKYDTCMKQECNKEPYYRKPTRKCFITQITNNKSSNEPMPCINSVPFWKKIEKCFKRREGEKYIYGCLNDHDEISCKQPFCETCESKDGCNDGDGNNEKPQTTTPQPITPQPITPQPNTSSYNIIEIVKITIIIITAVVIIIAIAYYFFHKYRKI